MPKIVFQEISVSATKRWKDADGKARQQTRKFTQTHNPFNRNAEGLPKTRDEIAREVMAERAAWLLIPAEDDHANARCQKVYHWDGEGFLHAGDDDSPYNVDGVRYCGRCHHCLPHDESSPAAGGATR